MGQPIRENNCPKRSPDGVNAFVPVGVCVTFLSHKPITLKLRIHDSFKTEYFPSHIMSFKLYARPWVFRKIGEIYWELLSIVNNGVGFLRVFVTGEA